MSCFTLELKMPFAPCLAPRHRYLAVGMRLSPLDQGGNAQEPPQQCSPCRHDVTCLLCFPFRNLRRFPVTSRLPSLGQCSSSSTLWEFSAFPQPPSSMQYGLVPGSLLTSMSQHVKFSVTPWATPKHMSFSPSKSHKTSGPP